VHGTKAPHYAYEDKFYIYGAGVGLTYYILASNVYVSASVDLASSAPSWQGA